MFEKELDAQWAISSQASLDEEGSTTIESIAGNSEEASRVESSDSKCRAV
jgi:hypothetical protein